MSVLFLFLIVLLISQTTVLAFNAARVQRFSGLTSSRMTIQATIGIDPLKEEISKEETRATQLRSLLDAFQSAVVEKEELLALEGGILTQMIDVRGTVADASILSELEFVIVEKGKQIDVETQVLDEISTVTATLAEEIAASLAKVDTLRQHADVSSPGADSALVSVSEWTRARDERVLSLINQFNAITQNKGLQANEKIPDALSGYIRVDGDDRSSSSNSSPIAGIRLSAATTTPAINDVAIAIRSKSNAEIAAVAGSTIGDSGAALVALTSCLLTAAVTFVTSPSGQLSGQAVGSAAAAMADSVLALREAWMAATKAYDSVDDNREAATGPAGTTPASTDASNGMSRMISGVQAAIKSAELKSAFSKVGGNLQKSAAEASKAVDIAVDQLSSSLTSMEKFAAAVSTLTESVTTLIVILGVATSRAVEEGRRQIMKELPQATQD